MSLATVLVPGLHGTPRLFAAQRDALGACGPVLVADHTRDDDVDAMARRLLAAAPARFALAGFSLGGFVALAVLRAAPERVERLALLDTVATADDPAAAEVRRAGIALAQAGDLDTLVDRSWPRLVHPSRQADAALRATVAEMAHTTGAAASVRQQTAMLTRPDARPGLAAIAVPTLVLVGDGDQIAPPARAEELAAAIPDARLVTVAGCGHLAPLERPAEVTAALVEWRVSPTPRPAAG